MKKLLLIFFCIFLLAFTIGYSKSEYNIPISPTSIFTDDIDLDNDIDIIIGHLTGIGYTNPSITFLKNNGTGYFDIFDTSLTYLGSQSDIFSNNLYGDYYPEIVTNFSEADYSKTSTYIRILNLNSSGVINFNDYFLSNEYGFSYKTYGDVNGNNHTDIIIASYGCQCWGILYNQGQGNFFEPEYFNVTYSPTDIKCGNLNNDEKDDIVVGAADVYIYFPTDTGFELTTFDNGSLHVFINDFDNDGDNDIVGIDGLYTWNYFSYMENTGDGNFIQHPDTTTHPGCFDFFLSDLDNDGLNEILGLSNSLSGIYIFYNKGDFHLFDPVFIPIDYYGESTRRIHCNDLDGNGYNDIIVTRGHGAPLPVGNVIILFNDGNGNFVEDPITDIKTPNPPVCGQALDLLCYPNPFITETTISFTLEKRERVQLHIFDISGQLIQTIVNKELPKGEHRFIWNSTDKFGNKIKKGIYFLTLNTTDKILHQTKIIKT